MTKSRTIIIKDTVLLKLGKITRELIAGAAMQGIFCFFYLLISIDTFGAIEVYENNEGRKVFIEETRTIKELVNVGTFKLNPYPKPDKEILEALRYRSDKGYKTNVLLDGRLSDTEKRGIANNDTQTSLKLFFQTGVKLTTLNQFSNNHFKILSSPNLVFVGTTNFDGAYSNFIKRDFTVHIDT